MRWNTVHARAHACILFPPASPYKAWAPQGFLYVEKNNNPLKLWPLGPNIQEFLVPAGSLAQIAAVTSGLYFYTVKHCEKMRPSMLPI